MADSLRGRLIPLVLCCVSGGLALQPQRASAEDLPPLQIDPALLGPAPQKTPLPTAAPPAAGAEPPQNGVTGSGAAPTPAASAGQAPSPPVSAAPAATTSLPATAPGQSIAPVAPLPAAPLAPSSRLTPVPRTSNEPHPSFVSGDRIRSLPGDVLVVEGNAQLRRIGNTLSADQIVYKKNEDEVQAEGHVRLTTDGNVVTGPKMDRKMDEDTGFFDQPVYALKREPAPGQALPAATGYGHADRLEFEGENVYRLKNATYTTCGPENPDWYAKTGDLLLDYNRQVGEGKNGMVVFKGVPLLYLPWLDFPLNNARKSGFLTPTWGTSSTSGMDVTAPYYWNIAPNMDATITPRVMARRGAQLGTEFRYLEPDYSGVAQYEYMPRDAMLGTSRSFYSLLHNQNFGHGLTGNLNVSGVSDATYFTDLASHIAVTSQVYMLRQGSFAYSGDWWNGTAGVQRYQTLQDPANPVTVPYDRLPYATLSANRPNFIGGTAFAFSGDFARFAVADPTNPGRPEGARTVLYPQLSWPMLVSGVTFTPKIGYNVTRYDLTQNYGNPLSLSRDVPIFSMDASATFERNTEWGGQNVVQTLEPRVFYLRVPSRDQSNIPVFDTGLADFNFAQIFAENIYSGNDRIADANQLTAAVTTRIIDPNTGAEAIRAAFGQRYYFRNQTVTLNEENQPAFLPVEVPRTGVRGDMLAAVTGLVMPLTYVDTAWQYNPRDKQTEVFTVGTRYEPEALKVLNVGYRFRRDSFIGAFDGIRDFDISSQWTLWGRWHGVGRYDYSIHDKRLVEALGGLEYDAGCWIGRVVLQRFATAFQTNTTTMFFQIELNGFARLGSDPMEVLRRSIPGYGSINENRTAPLFGIE